MLHIPQDDLLRLLLEQKSVLKQCKNLKQCRENVAMMYCDKIVWFIPSNIVMVKTSRLPLKKEKWYWGDSKSNNQPVLEMVRHEIVSKRWQIEKE